MKNEKVGLAILEEIINSIILKGPFYNNANIMGFINFLTDNSKYISKEKKDKILINIVDFLSEFHNSKMLTIEEHIKIVVMCSYYKLNNEHYIKTILEKNKINLNTFEMKSFFLICGEIGYNFNEEEIISLRKMRIFSKSISEIIKGLKLFLLLEDRFTNNS